MELLSDANILTSSLFGGRKKQAKINPSEVEADHNEKVNIDRTKARHASAGLFLT